MPRFLPGIAVRVCALIMTAALVLLDSGSARATPIVANGGFETGDLTGWTDLSPGADWTISASNPYHAPDRAIGGYAAWAGFASAEGYLSQALTTVPGEVYTLSLSMWNHASGVPSAFDYTIYWGGQVVDDGSTPTTAGWQSFRYTVTASSASTTLQIGIRNSPDWTGLDNVSVIPSAGAVVPEPVSLALALAGGLCSLAGRRRRSTRSRPA